MNYNFTERVRKALDLAREAAFRARHDHVGPEHILLGLIREGGGIGPAMLEKIGVRGEDVVRQIEEGLPRGRSTRAMRQLPYTSRAK